MMNLVASSHTQIAADPESVWAVIADIPNAAEHISAIKKIEIIEAASAQSIVGIKWKETREWMGKDATETMWVTDALSPSFYEVRAESHGCVYNSRLSIAATDTGSRLSMDFHCSPQTFGAKLMWLLTGWMARKSLRKSIDQDLRDIKMAIEQA